MDKKNPLVARLYAIERFMRFVIQHFIQDDCLYISSALAFTSLLAIVPLMSVVFTIFSSFPVFQGLADLIQNFIFDNFVPSTGKMIQEYVHQFTSKASKLPVWGILFILITALLVLYTIEKAMNQIWRVKSSRHGVAAFLLYWSILSLAPVLLGLSLVASSYLFSLPMLKNYSSPALFLNASPCFFSLIGFNFLYVIVPNCRVPLRHAFCGALVAATLFEGAKQAFAYYLLHFNAYELLYGAFASIPIFFIWIYLTWVITLLGAEISYAFSVHHQRRSGNALDGFSHALLWLNHLWLAQKKGRALSYNELIETSDQPFAVDVDDMISTLIDASLIQATTNSQYLLSRDLTQITLYDLTQLLPYRLPTHLELQYSKSSLAQRWSEVFKKNNEHLKKSLAVSLEDLFMNQEEQAS